MCVIPLGGPEGHSRCSWAERFTNCEPDMIPRTSGRGRGLG